MVLFIIYVNFYILKLGVLRDQISVKENQNSVVTDSLFIIFSELRIIYEPRLRVIEGMNF